MSQYMKGLSIKDENAATPAIQPQSGTNIGFNDHVSPQPENPVQTSAPSTSIPTTPNELYQKPVPSLAPSANSSNSSRTATNGLPGQPASTDFAPRQTNHLARDNSSSASSRHSQTQIQQHPLESQQDAPVTALNSVVVPALEAALHRRNYQLSLLTKHHNAALPTLSPAAAAQADRELAERKAQHDLVRKCMVKVCKLFKDIDYIDSASPVGMGDGVEGLLEGFLEEVLCRVEAEDA